MVTMCLCLLAGTEQDNSSQRWPENQSTSSVKLDNHEVSETKQHLQNLLQGMQYSPLHLPSFPSGLVPPGIVPTIHASTSAVGGTSSKIRGASDCPGQCALCGATLRQARNLRRHLLTSCKYRFNSHPNSQHLQDQMVVEIKPDIDMSGYIGPTYMTDSGGSNSCEPLVFRTSPLPSPTSRNSDVVSNHQNGPPTVAR